MRVHFLLPQGSRILESSLYSAKGEEPVEYKSLQWFGATVRAHGSSILACAPLYSWRTEKDPQNDPVGTCYLSTENFTRILEYAPCRSGRCQSVVDHCAFSVGGSLVPGAFSSRPPGIDIYFFKAAQVTLEQSSFLLLPLFPVSPSVCS